MLSLTHVRAQLLLIFDTLAHATTVRFSQLAVRNTTDAMALSTESLYRDQEIVRA
jgi:hypothetical protein